MELQLEWFHDCGGKKSCDTNIVHTITRYYPTGGSTFIMKDGRMVKGDDGSLPYGFVWLYANGSRIVERKFEGQTEEEVMLAMEKFTLAVSRRMESFAKFLVSPDEESL